MRAAYAVALLFASGALLLVALRLGDRAETSAGTNGQLLASYVATVPPGRELCQEGETLPAGAGAVELFAGSFGRPGPALTIAVDGAEVAQARSGYRDGWLRLGLDGAARDRRTPALDVRLCVRNRGDVEVAFAGLLQPPPTAARVGARPADGRISVRWPSARGRSWAELAPVVATRATLGKADFGRWVPAILLVAAWAGALALVLRAGRA